MRPIEIDNDAIQFEVAQEVAEDTSITDSLLDYATREELDDFYQFLVKHYDEQLGRLLRRVHRRAMAHERARRIESRCERAVAEAHAARSERLRGVRG